MLIPVQLFDSVSELGERDVTGARNGIGQKFRIFTDIQYHCVFRYLVVTEPNQPRQEVFGNEACHVHRILGRGIWRRIGELQVFQILHRAAEPNDSGNNVDPLIRTVCSHDLGAQHLPGRHPEDQLNEHRRRTRIESHMGVLGQYHGRVIFSFCLSPSFQFLLIQTGGSRRHVEYLGDGSAVEARIFHIPPRYPVGDDPAFLRSRTCKGCGLSVTCDDAVCLHHISGGIDVRIRGFHELVDLHVTSFVQLQAGILRKPAVRLHPDGKDYRLCRNDPAALENDIQSVLFFIEMIHSV